MYGPRTRCTHKTYHGRVLDGGGTILITGSRFPPFDVLHDGDAQKNEEKEKNETTTNNNNIKNNSN